MKQETIANKLAKLLKIEDKVDTTAYSDKPVSKRSKRFAGIPEEEIQTYREGQALILFFQAPELYTPKICKHCGTSFLVSRHQVSYCSYDCVERECLKITGVKWTRKKDMELMVKEVWEGNEPLIIRNIDRIRKVLDEAETEITRQGTDSVGV